MHSFRKLLPHLRPYRFQLGVVLVSAVGLTTVNLLHPLVVRRLLHLLRGGQANNRIHDPRTRELRTA